MEKITETKLKNGRPAFYGFCPDCKTKIIREDWRFSSS